jgi:hypothetical protein
MEKDILELENQKVQKQLTINYLTEQKAQFYETKGGFVGLKIGNEDYGHVNLIRTFPFSAPWEFISVRRLDGKQEEIGIIDNLNHFDSSVFELISKQLEIRYFMPKITKIISINEEYGHAYWNVLTDKGKCSFATSAGASGAVTKNEDRVIIKDTDENRFEIEDITKLTAKELKKLDLFL